MQEGLQSKISIEKNKKHSISYIVGVIAVNLFLKSSIQSQIIRQDYVMKWRLCFCGNNTLDWSHFNIEMRIFPFKYIKSITNSYWENKLDWRSFCMDQFIWKDCSDLNDFDTSRPLQKYIHSFDRKCIYIAERDLNLCIYCDRMWVRSCSKKIVYYTVWNSTTGPF